MCRGFEPRMMSLENFEPQGAKRLAISQLSIHVRISTYIIPFFVGWFENQRMGSLLVLEWTVRCSRTVQFFVMFDMFEVRFWAKMWCSEVFKVRSCCYVTRLVLELTVWCSRTVRVFVMFDMFEVRFWAKMWCSESSMFGHSMFGVFEVRYFGVRSKTSTHACRHFCFFIF